MSHRPADDTTHARAPRARRFFGATLAVLVLSVCAADAVAQETSPPPAPARQQQARDASDGPRTSAEEDFELNISERRITAAEDYEASTAVGVGDAAGRGLNLRVGVALGASRIDVLLRNVRGRVRFRASLAPVLERLAPRAAPTPPTQGSPAPPPAPPSP